MIKKKHLSESDIKIDMRKGKCKFIMFDIGIQGFEDFKAEKK